MKISAMTDEELRIAIAEKLGWKFTSALEHTGYGVDALTTVTRPCGRSGKFHPSRMLQWTPNWPDNAGAALALCMEIGAPTFMYPLVVPFPNGKYRAGFVRPTEQGMLAGQMGFVADVIHTAEADTPARALSELAALTLGVGND